MSADALTVETFTEYGIGMLFLLVRLFARLNIGGLRGLQLDDAFAVAGMVCSVSPSFTRFVLTVSWQLFWTTMTAIIYLLGKYQR